MPLERTTAPDDADLVAAIEADEAALEQLARDHYTDRLITRGEFLAARGPLEARLADARRQLVASRPSARQSVAGPDVRQRWEAMGLDWRRAVLGDTVERVVVNPATRGRVPFEADRVEIVWR